MKKGSAHSYFARIATVYLILMMGANFGTGRIASDANVGGWHETEVLWPRDVGRPTAAFPTFVSERQSCGHGRRYVARHGMPRRALASKLDLL